MPATCVLCSNVDAAFFEQDNLMGVGMVLGDDAGKFMTCGKKFLPGVACVEEGEAQGPS